jgi:hypothetical protein
MFYLYLYINEIDDHFFKIVSIVVAVIDLRQILVYS